MYSPSSQLLLGAVALSLTDDKAGVEMVLDAVGAEQLAVTAVGLAAGLSQSGLRREGCRPPASVGDVAAVRMLWEATQLAAERNDLEGAVQITQKIQLGSQARLAEVVLQFLVDVFVGAAAENDMDPVRFTQAVCLLAASADAAT
jgi:hypothetical protein